MRTRHSMHRQVAAHRDSCQRLRRVLRVGIGPLFRLRGRRPTIYAPTGKDSLVMRNLVTFWQPSQTCRILHSFGLLAKRLSFTLSGILRPLRVGSKIGCFLGSMRSISRFVSAVMTI